MTDLYIFDIDGTLADGSHRVHLIQGEKKDWTEYFALCRLDAPIWPVINILKTLRRSGAQILFFSGRSDEVRKETVQWLEAYLGNAWDELMAPGVLTMREAGDYTQDDILKEIWLHRMLDEDRQRLVAVFDDRDRVVAMWRRNGVQCFQVAPGDF